MPGLPVFFLPIVLGIFNLQVNWAASSRDGVNITLGGQDQFINQCLQNGLQVSYRFKTRICKRRTLWFDSCEAERIDTHAIQYDPISQNYEIVTDTHHDAEGPEQVTYSERDAALAAAASLRSVLISKLPRRRGEKIDPHRYYLGIRAVTECKGESGIIAQIPLILSFGIVNTSVSDSGWVAFDLDSGKIVSP